MDVFLCLSLQTVRAPKKHLVSISTVALKILNCSKNEVAYQEVVAFKKQEKFTREEEAASLVETETKSEAWSNR